MAHVRITLDVIDGTTRTFETRSYAGMLDRVAFERHYHETFSAALTRIKANTAPDEWTLFLIWRVAAREVPDVGDFDAFLETLNDFDVDDLSATSIVSANGEALPDPLDIGAP